MGTTNDPIFDQRVRGEAGDLNDRVFERLSQVFMVNDGTPDAPAVSAFNTLAFPIRWSHIGSRIEMGIQSGTSSAVVTQVYPTYLIYANRARVEPVRLQAPEPIANFSVDPNPPGPAPFIPPPE